MNEPRKSRKQLTREDHDIWGRVKNTIQPLSEAEKNFSSLFQEMTLQELPHQPPAKSQTLNSLNQSTAPVYQPSPQPKPQFSTSQLDIKTTRKISKGKISIDGRLDLHGYTQQDAHSLLYDYLENAYYSGKRTILIITGKGNLGRGVLRENVPKWLAEPVFRRLISSFGDSHLTHGGGGAIYVRIRRKP